MAAKKAGKKDDAGGISTLTNSYLMVDTDKVNGVVDRLYNFTDYNKFSKPAEDVDLSSGAIVITGGGGASLPDPIIGKHIQLPDGDTTVTALGWQASGEQDSGLNRIGTNNYGEYVNGTLVYDWSSTRLKLASNYYLYLGATAPITVGTDTELIAGVYSYNGPLRYAIQNTSFGTGAHSTLSAVTDTRLDVSLVAFNSGYSGAPFLAQEVGVIGNNGFNGGSGGTGGMFIFNSMNSYLRFGANNTEWMRLLATGLFGVNTTTARRRIDSLDTSNPQLRLTYTDNAVYTDFKTDSGGDLTITPTGGDVIITGNINNTQNIFWKSGTAFYGTFDHAITAIRTWTFPNASGTVLTTATASGLFTQGSVLFADSTGQLDQNNASFFWDNTNVLLQLDSPTHSGTIKFPSNDGPYTIQAAPATFNGVVDNVLYYCAYNKGRPTVTEPSYALSMESHYFDAVTHWMELNWDYVSSDGLTSKRFFSQQIDRTTHSSQMAFTEQSDFWWMNSSVYFVRFTKTSQLCQFYDAAGTVKFTVDTTTSPSVTMNSARWSNAGTNNLFIGVTTGNFTLSGSNNTGMGGANLSSLTSGAQNAAYGTNALSAVTSGLRNTAVGNGALQTITTVNDCSALGNNALLLNTAAGNSAFGSSAMAANTSGASNSAFGLSALGANQTNSNCAAFGYQALQSSKADDNNAFGYQALSTCVSGKQNAAFGKQALFTINTGKQCSAFGHGALFSTTVDNGTAVGYLSLFSVSSGTDNTALGKSSGFTLTTGDHCTFLGSAADTSVNNLTYACAIGAGAIVGASNTIALGGTGTPVVKVVINGTTASARLHVTEPTVGNEVLRLESTATNDDPADKYSHGRVTTTDATQTTINTVAITASNTYIVEATVRARRTGGTGGTAEDAAGYIVTGTYKTVAGVVTLVGAVTAIYTAEDQAAWDATLDINGTNVRVRVTGAANNDVVWHSTVVVRNVGT